MSSPEYALRLMRIPTGKIPYESHTEEDFPAPEEVFSLEKILRDGGTRLSQLSSAKRSNSEAREVVVSARLMDHGDLAEEHGPVALLL